MRRIGSICIVAMLMLVATVMATPIESSPQISNPAVTTSETSTFHGVANSSWYAVKFSCYEAVMVDELYVGVASRHTDMRRSEEMFVLVDSNYTVLTQGGSGFRVKWHDDLIFHVDWWLFNYSYEHLSSTNFSEKSGHWRHNVSLSPDTYYLICLQTPGSNSSISTWINVTGDVDFEGTTMGNTTYLLDATDFLGKFNLYWFNGSIIWDGALTFSIDHIFVGKFHIRPTFGVTITTLTNPSGAAKKEIIIDLGFKSSGGARRYRFGNEVEGMMVDPASGTWAMELNTFQLGGIPILRAMAPPGFVFYYGDVRLPQ